jgi:hypothetical protein
VDPDSKEYSPAALADVAGVAPVTFGQWRARHGLLKNTTVRYSLVDICVVRAVAVLAMYSFKMDEVIALVEKGTTTTSSIRYLLHEILRERLRGRLQGIIVRVFEDKEHECPAAAVWLDLNAITDHVIDHLNLDLPVKSVSAEERRKQLRKTFLYLDSKQFKKNLIALKEKWATEGPQSWWTVATILGIPFWCVQMALTEEKKRKPPLSPIVNRVANDLGVDVESLPLR